MLHINYDRNCAYRPVDLGLQIAQLLTNKNIERTFKFIMFQDRVVRNADGSVDDSKHMCLLYMLDDADDSEKSLRSMNDVAAFLLQNEEIRNECGAEEGIFTLVDDEGRKFSFADAETADRRLRVMLLDDRKFREFTKEAKEGISGVDRFGYSEEDGYYCVSRINENGLRQFEENGLDYRGVCLKEESAFALRFVKAHWPDDWEKMSMSADLVDTGEVVYDEEEKVNRHVWKFTFRLYDAGGNEVKGEHALGEATT